MDAKCRKASIGNTFGLNKTIEKAKGMSTKRASWIAGILGFIFLAGGCATKQPLQPQPSFQAQPLAMEMYRQKADNVLFVLDASSSMTFKFNEEEKFNVARNVVANFNQTMPDLKIQAGLRSFGHSLCFSWKSTLLNYGLSDYSRQGITDALSIISPAGGPSPMDKALKAAAEDLKAAQGKIAMVVVSDGEDMGNAPLNSAQDLKAQYGDRLCIYTVLVGADKAGGALLSDLSMVTGCGQAVTAADVATGPAMADFVTTVLLEKVEPPTLGVFKDINFESDKAVLMASSTPTLEEIVKILNDFPNVSVEIQGHTDSTASEAHNMDLSQRRAKTVMEYLISRGIPASRLTAQGYGESRPIDTNATAAGKAKNRRVELKPIK